MRKIRDALNLSWRLLSVWWKRSGTRTRLLVFGLGVFCFSLLVYWQSPSVDDEYLGSNLSVFLIVNLNIVILCVLGFLIGRNIVKLAFDLRRKVFGARLRTTLVLTFLGLILIPTIFLFVLASGLINTAMEGWFGGQVESAVSASLDVARHHYKYLKRDLSSRTDRLSLVIAESGQNPTRLRRLLKSFKEKNSMFSVRLFDEHFQLVAVAEHPASGVQDFEEPPLDLEHGLSSGNVILEERGSNQYLRVYAKVKDTGLTLVVTKRLDSELTAALLKVNDSFKEYQQLKLFKNPIKSGYLLTLALITALIMFGAIWIAFYMAREITTPIQRLAEGTRAVAKGRYDFQVRVAGDDEVGELVKSFNSMVFDLKHSREEIEVRRAYLEVVLENLAVGVVALGEDLEVVTFNSAAANSLGIERSVEDSMGVNLKNLVPAKLMDMLEDLLRSVTKAGASTKAGNREISFLSGGMDRRLVCTVARISTGKNIPVGLVLVVDDITELVKAQHLVAWRDVARRIAHEIKNPLTPIQLCAQRLVKLVGASEVHSSKGAMEECAQTIVSNVSSIKRLANEFSEFARMPEAKFEPGNINDLIAETVAPFVDSNPNIIFKLYLSNEMPNLYFDQEQIRRLIINLVDNAIGAIQSSGAIESPSIVLSTTSISEERLLRLVVADNGPGIKDLDKVRVFEPYFTTKEGGMGLGLAVVHSIVLEHNGKIKVFDNHPSGTKFEVELPIRNFDSKENAIVRA